MWAMSVVKDSRGGNELWGERNLLDLVKLDRQKVFDLRPFRRL